MDKKIVAKKWPLKRILSIVAVVGLLGAALYYFRFSDFSSPKQNIDFDRITVAEVEKGAFQEYVIETGEVVPDRTFFLDAIEGGNIVNVIKESGSIIKKGDPIIILENANLRLNVLSQENSLNEQLNRVRTTRLQLDQNFLNHKKELATIEYQLQILGPKFTRDSTLFAKKLIPAEVFQATKADFQYNLKRLKFTSESYKTDSTSRDLQLEQLSTSEVSMLKNLKGVKKILNNLVVKAPIAGQLTTGQLQEGQNINQGERIGQIDILGSYKARVPIDELYLPRISKGLNATVSIDNKPYSLNISYIYPTIANGEFEVDMEFANGIPENVKSGQSLRLKIELGKSSEEVLIPVGGFYNNTGGNWIFVIDEEGKTAQRRNVRLGRKNAQHYQVLEGIEPGEKVITSSYDSFGDNEVLAW